MKSKRPFRCTGHNYLTQDTPLPYCQHSFPESPQDSQELLLNELHSASLEAQNHLGMHCGVRHTLTGLLFANVHGDFTLMKLCQEEVRTEERRVKKIVV